MHLIRIDNSASNGFRWPTQWRSQCVCGWRLNPFFYLKEQKETRRLVKSQQQLSRSWPNETFGTIESKMSVARPSETGCRLVRIKRVPSCEFQSSSHPISVARQQKNLQQQQQQQNYLPPITLRNGSAPSGVNRIWINQRHSDAWYSASRFVVAESPFHHQVYYEKRLPLRARELLFSYLGISFFFCFGAPISPLDIFACLLWSHLQVGACGVRAHLRFFMCRV